MGQVTALLQTFVGTALRQVRKGWKREGENGAMRKGTEKWRLTAKVV